MFFSILNRHICLFVEQAVFYCYKNGIKLIGFTFGEMIISYISSIHYILHMKRAA